MIAFIGRPRKVTDKQVAAILAWKENQKSLKELAVELGLKVSTVKYVLAVDGQFKQPSPEKREKGVGSQARRKANEKGRDS